MAELCHLSASEAAELMARGKITALALAESCLAQVIGPFGGDARTLAFAERVHRTFVG